MVVFDFGTNANNPLNTGQPFSNALLGVFNTYTEATANPKNLWWSAGFDTYVEDTWRVTRKLTLDYGLRLSWYEPFYSPTNAMAGFNLSMYNPSQAVQLIRPALSGGKTVGVNPVTGQIYSVRAGGIHRARNRQPHQRHGRGGRYARLSARAIQQHGTSLRRRASASPTIRSATVRPQSAADSACSITGRRAPRQLRNTPIRWCRRRWSISARCPPSLLRRASTHRLPWTRTRCMRSRSRS